MTNATDQICSQKALELGLKPLVIINKIDKPTAQPDAVVDMLLIFCTTWCY